MSEMCGKELGKHGVTMLSLWPGLVQTEHILEMKEGIEKAKVVSSPLVFGLLNYLSNTQPSDLCNP